jgi:phage terminase small subunit
MREQNHLIHGLYVRSRNGLKLRDRKVSRLVREMYRVVSWLEESDEPSCRAWAQLEVLALGVYAELRDRGFVGPEGEPRKLLAEFRALRQAQTTLSRELGLTPSARKALVGSGSRGVDIAAEFARMNAEDAAEGKGE